jgi:hypothetical protein
MSYGLSALARAISARKQHREELHRGDQDRAGSVRDTPISPAEIIAASSLLDFGAVANEFWSNTSRHHPPD